jgi:hypothetical protein
MRKTPAVPTTRHEVPAYLIHKLSVGQILTVGQYPKQQKYEILHVNFEPPFVKCKPKK